MRRIKVSEAARRADVHTGTILRWIRTGLLNAVKIAPSGHWRIDPDELDQLLKGDKKPTADVIREIRQQRFEEICSS